jgi:hypothetical protein
MFIILIGFYLITSSCQSRRSKLDRKHLIPEDELVSTLTDIYLTDGLIGMPMIITKYLPIDSISTYNYIIEKHGYSPEIMDKTIKYYFIKKPKKLIKIYDKVLGILSEMESRAQKEIAKSKLHLGDLWTGLDLYSFPDPSGTDSVFFDIALKKPGVFTLNLTVTLFPDDQSFNPRLTAFSCHPDSIETGKRNYTEPIYYFRDGLPHKYSIHFNVPIKTILHARGCLYEFDNHPDDWDKHLVIQNISVIYSLVEL